MHTRKAFAISDSLLTIERLEESAIRCFAAHHSLLSAASPVACAL